MFVTSAGCTNLLRAGTKSCEDVRWLWALAGRRSASWQLTDQTEEGGRGGSPSPAGLDSRGTWIMDADRRWGKNICSIFVKQGGIKGRRYSWFDSSGYKSPGFFSQNGLVQIITLGCERMLLGVVRRKRNTLDRRWIHTKSQRLQLCVTVAEDQLRTLEFHDHFVELEAPSILAPHLKSLLRSFVSWLQQQT